MLNAKRPAFIVRAWRFFLFKLNNFYIYSIGRLIRGIRAPGLPVNADGKVLIHIGCGEMNDPRYINIDKRKLAHIHYIGSAEDLSAVPMGCADLIYMSHILEHVSHLKLKKVLSDLKDRLKEGGVLRIAVPDFTAMLQIYRETGKLEDIVPPLMGGQEYPENFHASVYDAAYLSGLLTNAGFKTVRKWDPATADFHNFDDWSKRPFIVNGKQYPISLNLEAVK